MDDATHAADVVDGGEALLAIRPGQALADSEWALVTSHAVAAFELPAEQLLTTPYGYIPMPRPPTADAHGLGKVPEGVAYDVALHPVLWLPRRVRQQRRDEPDDVYAVRLWLELVDRGVLDAETQQPANPFHVWLEVDTDHPDVRRDVADYCAGEPVGWLCDFAVGDETAPSGADLADLAQRLVDQHRRDYHALRASARDHAHRQLRAALAAVDAADLRRDAAEVLTAGEQLRHHPDDAAAGKALRDAVDAAADRIAALDRHRANLTVAVSRWQRAADPVDLADVEEQLADDDAQRRQTLEAAYGKTRTHPTDATLRHLWTTLHQQWSAVAAEARRAAHAARPHLEQAPADRR